MINKTFSLHANQSGTFHLGKTFSIYRLGFGAMRVTGSGIWGPPKNVSEALALLKRVPELGVNFIDTADSYGPEVSENLLAEALHPYPKGLVIATKGGLVRPGPGEWVPNCKPEYLTSCVEKSLRRLKKECLDLYQLHTVDPRVPIEESLLALKKMQAQGKIRLIGLSNVTVAEIERAKKVVEVVSVQNRYNLDDRHSEDVLKYCESQKIAFIPWFPIGSGELAKSFGPLSKLAKQKKVTPAQLSIAWLLNKSPVMVPIPGTSSIPHLEENIAAASISLTKEEMNQLES